MGAKLRLYCECGLNVQIGQKSNSDDFVVEQQIESLLFESGDEPLGEKQ